MRAAASILASFTANLTLLLPLLVVLSILELLEVLLLLERSRMDEPGPPAPPDDDVEYPEEEVLRRGTAAGMGGMDRLL